ncbi:MAG: type II transport protein GspH [Pseudohongiella sp.]|nr:type II transport protein GspH [Pseudohongiella sp.]
MKIMKTIKAQLGLTLLELMITLFLLSILLGVSMPEFKTLMERKKAELSIRKLAGAIELAKSSAIASSSLVTLCRSFDGAKCGGKWQDGLIIFTDSNADRKINQQDKLLHSITFPLMHGELRWRAFQNRQYLQITHLGFTRYQNGNFTYCPEDKNPKFASQLIINRTGRVRFAIDSDDDGIKEDSQGRAITCR